MKAQQFAGSQWKVKRWWLSNRLCMACLMGVLTAGCIGRGMAIASDSEASQTWLTVSTDDSGTRTKVTLNVHVRAVSGIDVPGGLVNFRSGALDLGSAILDGDGDASLTTNNLAAGSHQVVAVYQGGGSFAGSISASALVKANATTAAGFTVTANPTTLSVPAGQFVTSDVTITPVNGFDAYVSLSCSGLPTGATCTFTPTNVLASCTGSGSSATCTPGASVLQIQTTGTSGPQTKNGPGSRSKIPIHALVLPFFLALFGLACLTRRTDPVFRNRFLLVTVVLSITLAITACNERYNYLNHGPPTATGTAIGTYTITIDSSSSTGSEVTTPPTNPQLTLNVTAQE